GYGDLSGIERNTLPDRLGHRPRAQNRGELIRVLYGPMLGAKAENGPGLFGSNARKLEELGGIGEVDSHSVRHGRLLHKTNARSDRVVGTEHGAQSSNGRMKPRSKLTTHRVCSANRQAASIVGARPRPHRRVSARSCR